MKTLLKFIGYFFGFIFCLAGIATGLSLSLANFISGISMLIFGLWLFKDIRDKLFSRLPTKTDGTRIRTFIGVFLFGVMCIAINISGNKNSYEVTPLEAVVSVPNVTSREEAIEKRNRHIKEVEDARRAELLGKRDAAVLSMKQSLADKKFDDVASLAAKFKTLGDPEIEAAAIFAQRAIDENVKRETAENSKKEQAIKANEMRDKVFFSEKDEMTGRTIKREIFESKNTVEFSFPYNGGTTAWLELRNHPQYGKDVVLRLSKGQLLCHSYSNCSVGVSIDDGAPFNVTGIGPEDNSSLSVFINWSLVAKIRNAKSLKIQVPTFQNGRPVFEFDLAGIDIGRLN